MGTGCAAVPVTFNQSFLGSMTKQSAEQGIIRSIIIASYRSQGSPCAAAREGGPVPHSDTIYPYLPVNLPIPGSEARYSGGQKPSPRNLSLRVLL